VYRSNCKIPAATQTIGQLITHPRSNTQPVAVDGSNNDTISHGEEAGGSGAPALIMTPLVVEKKRGVAVQNPLIMTPLFMENNETIAITTSN